MKIGNSFNPEKAEQSLSYAYKCWHSYNYEKNPMGITAEEMQTITRNWQSEVSKWEANAAQDDNAYEIDDDDLSFNEDCNKPHVDSRLDKNARIKSFEKNNKGTVEKLNDSSAANGALNGLTGLNGLTTAFSVTSAFVDEISVEACTAGIMAACSLSFLISTLYYAIRPNKKEKEALILLEEMMLEQQNKVADTRAAIESYEERISELTEGVFEASEENDKTLEDKQKQYESCMEVYNQILERAKNGEQISDEDRELLKEIGKLLQDLGKEIAELSEENEEFKEDSLSDIGDYEDSYNSANEALTESASIADSAASYDESVKKAAHSLGISQSLNATMGFINGALAAAFSWFAPSYAPFAAMGVAAGGMSTAAACEQFDIEKRIDQEINVRKETQAINEDAFSQYDDSVVSFEQYYADAEDVEFEVPEELTGLEDFEVPEIPDTPQAPETTAPTQADDSTKEKPDSTPASTSDNPVSSNGNTSINPFANSTGNSNSAGSWGSSPQDDDKKNPFI